MSRDDRKTIAVRLRPNAMQGDLRRCDFEIVRSAKEQSPGTVAGGDATCPFGDCGRVIDYLVVRQQCVDDQMGDQLFAVVYKRAVRKLTKSGRDSIKWERGYRAPRPEDDNSSAINAQLAEKLPEWEALGCIPTETIPPQHPKYSLDRWGLSRWTQLFSPRQLLGHGTAVEVFRELLAEAQAAGPLGEAQRAAFVYLALALDKLRDYNSRMTHWHSTREVVAGTFDRHDFAFKWSYVEMAPLIVGLGFDWAIEQAGKCIGELVQLLRGDAAEGGKKRSVQPSLSFDAPRRQAKVQVRCGSAAALAEVADGSVAAVVIDPPYYDNVMYAELSDFFYVWLKRTAGLLLPELFGRYLTDKDAEAVANPGRFREQPRPRELAAADYRAKMAEIFIECRRVLQADGIMTLMFTHKATGAWDALALALVEAGFVITASWPVNTEAEGSLHVKDKAAANSTIFLVCRPRAEQPADAEPAYWEQVEPLVAAAVRQRVADFQAAGIRGVDLYLSCFGPALEAFSRHWPLRRGQPRSEPTTPSKRRGKRAAPAELVFEKPDPYVVNPEDALDAARREVKRWRLAQLMGLERQSQLDPLSEFFVLAWDAFEAPVFPFDEALRLSRVVGVDLEGDVVGTLAEKKGSDLILWDSGKRAAKGAIRSSDGAYCMLDALHHAIVVARRATLEQARETLEKSGATARPSFCATLEAVLEVLPVSRSFTQIDADSPAVAEAASDFETLEHLRRLAFSEKVRKPKQLEIWE